jgi:carbon storage regulator CsrA
MVTMLIVGREIGQSVIIGDEIKVTVTQKNSQLQLLIYSPDSIEIRKIEKGTYSSGGLKKRNHKLGETVLIGDQVKLTILQTESGLLRFAIDAPKEISVFREEIYKNIVSNQLKNKKLITL